MTRFKKLRPGTCRVCGCTDDNACVEGCWWVDLAHTLCSACEATPDDLAQALVWIKTVLDERDTKARPAADVIRRARAIAAQAVKRFDSRQKEESHR